MRLDGAAREIALAKLAELESMVGKKCYRGSREILRHPETWPFRPWTALWKPPRRHPVNMAFVHESDLLRIYLGSMFLGVEFHGEPVDVGKHERKAYDSLDALLADGWVVDWELEQLTRIVGKATDNLLEQCGLWPISIGNDSVLYQGRNGFKVIAKGDGIFICIHPSEPDKPFEVFGYDDLMTVL